MAKNLGNSGPKYSRIVTDEDDIIPEDGPGEVTNDWCISTLDSWQ